MAVEFQGLIGVSKVPNFDSPVHIAGNQRLSIRTQLDAADRARMAAQTSDFFRSGDVPENHEAVPCAAGQPVSIPSEME